METTLCALPSPVHAHVIVVPGETRTAAGSKAYPFSPAPTAISTDPEPVSSAIEPSYPVASARYSSTASVPTVVPEPPSVVAVALVPGVVLVAPSSVEIGRASCRERVCLYV